MNRSSNLFASLSAKAERGDAEARRQLHRQLEPQVVHIVRRVLRDGAGRSPLDRRILVEATRLGEADVTDSREARERLIHAVARRVCSSVIANLPGEDERQADETVCNSGMRMTA